MRYSHALALCAGLFSAGCQLQAPTDSRDPGSAAVGYESLPQGRNFLITDTTAEGDPIYSPVKFIGDQAIMDGDIEIARGDSALDAIRARLVDPRTVGPLAKSTGFVQSITYTGGTGAWPGGVIHYSFGAGVDQPAILAAIHEYNQAGGVTYLPWDGKAPARVVFIKVGGTLSSSAVGRVSPNQIQTINLSNFARGVIMHEMAHAAGMYHEHQRPDRDTYVNISSAGPDPDGRYNADFAKKTDGTMVGAYDYTSLMHYGKTTVQYNNSDGTYFFAQVVPKDGHAINNTAFSASDKSALWGIQVNGNPLFPQTPLSGTDALISKLYITYNPPDGKVYTWEMIYNPTTGNIYVYKTNANHSLGASVWGGSVGTGFTKVIPYQTGAGTYAMMFYSAGSGAVRQYQINPANGLLGNQIYNGSYYSGWSNIEAYRSGSNSFLFFQNLSNYQVGIWKMNNDGTLGAQTYSGTWSGWVFSKPFYLETSPYVTSAYFVFRGVDGLTRIRKMPDTGILGDIVQDFYLATNATAIGLYQSVVSAYLVLRAGQLVYQYDIGTTGFRPNGQVYRISNPGYTVVKFDAASDVFASAGGAGIPANNKYLSFKHVASWGYQEAPNVLFYGALAPGL